MQPSQHRQLTTALQIRKGGSERKGSSTEARAEPRPRGAGRGTAGRGPGCGPAPCSPSRSQALSALLHKPAAPKQNTSPDSTALPETWALLSVPPGLDLKSKPGLWAILTLHPAGLPLGGISLHLPSSVLGAQPQVSGQRSGPLTRPLQHSPALGLPGQPFSLN